jgi:hypothetical protein
MMSVLQVVDIKYFIGIRVREDELTMMVFVIRITPSPILGVDNSIKTRTLGA